MEKPIFCANCQKETIHTGEVDRNHELVFTCECGRFIKLPANITPIEAESYFATHKASNEGQVSAEEVEKEEEEAQKTLEALSTPTIVPAPSVPTSEPDISVEVVHPEVSISSPNPMGESQSNDQTQVPI